MSDSFKKFWDACLADLSKANAPVRLIEYCQQRAANNKGTIKAELRHWQQLQANPQRCLEVLGCKKTIWTATVLAALLALGKDGHLIPDERRKAVQELHELVLSLMLKGNEQQKVHKALQHVYRLLNVQPSPEQQQQIDAMVQDEFSELYGAIAALRFCGPVEQAMQNGKTGGKNNKARGIRTLINNVLATSEGQALLKKYEGKKRGFPAAVFALLKPNSPYAALEKMPFIARNVFKNKKPKELVCFLAGDWGWKHVKGWEKIGSVGKKAVYGEFTKEKTITFNAFSSAVSRARKDLKKKNS